MIRQTRFVVPRAVVSVIGRADHRTVFVLSAPPGRNPNIQLTSRSQPAYQGAHTISVGSGMHRGFYTELIPLHLGAIGVRASDIHRQEKADVFATTDNRAVFLFPGLGAYAPAALRQARVEYPQAIEIVKEIDEAAADHGIPAVAPVLLGDEELSIEEMLSRPAVQLQVAIFAISIATHRILMDEGAHPYALVGHSFGEIAALVAGGAFTLADGVHLVSARAKALEALEGRGAMAAISVNAEMAGHLISVLDEPDLVVACFNAPRQTVLSGPVAAIERARGVAEALGAFFTVLYLPYASHHPSMRPAVATFAESTRTIVQQPLELPVISPIHGRRYTDDDDLTAMLGQCLVLPVRFTDTIRDLHSMGVSSFIEVGALKALTRCAELTVPAIRTVAPLLDPAQAGSALRDAARAGGLPAASAPVQQVKSRRPMESAPKALPVLATEASPVEAPVSAAPPPTPVPEALPRPDVLEQLRTLYADLLEYPPDLLTDEALLEADLGVDSLKQTALLTKVIDHFELTRPDGGVQVPSYPSLGHIADFVLERLAVR
ncbi:acyltransferase domain-containing protein [Nocardia sp. NPDC051570]|uniref:acyltransferase domain-containing protein n=1 Tax=Nocardia sp. NPDC051570 TaxID=3364324 RepID=UPI00379B594A